MKFKLSAFLSALALSAGLLSAPAQAQETIRIAFIDPLSGPFASVGSNGLIQFQFAAEELVNKKGGLLILIRK